METRGQNKYAILAGIDNYLHGDDLPALKSPTNDIKQLKKVLNECEYCNFTVETLDNPSCQQLSSLLEDILSNRAKNDDMVLIYFSGHGKLNNKGDLCLCTNDTNPDLLKSTSISLPTLKQMIDETRAAQIVILLDSCYSGAGIGAFKSGMNDIIKKGIGSGKGKYIITSSTSFQTSLELAKDNLSLFTKWMIQGLESWEADINNDGIITIEELYNYARDHTVEEHPDQHPQNYGFGTTPADIIIAQKPNTSDHGISVEAINSEYLPILKTKFKNGKIIPFLGDGVFSKGPLSSFSILNKLAESSGIKIDENQSCATIAECSRQKFDDREEFLDTLKRVLAEDQEKAEIEHVHKCIAEKNEIDLVISSTYDTVFENYLINIKKPFKLVCHILYSPDDKYNGRILVIDFNGENVRHEIVDADGFIMQKGDFVIYKILGTPFIEDLCEKCTGLDTVIITESDHTKFLAYLENQYMRVPNAFRAVLKTIPLIFLGYNLDTWHYRLIAQVFDGSNQNTRVKSPYAIRQTTSPIEALFWDRLRAKLIEADVKTFVEILTAD